MERATIKVKLNKLLYDNIDYSDLHKSISSTNELISIGYLFMRSYLLHLFETKDIIDLKFNVEFIRLAFSVISFDGIGKKGRPFDNSKQQLAESLSDYYKIFRDEVGAEYKNTGCISYILGQSFEQIHVAVINNIKYHFDKHVWKFLKAKFNDKYKRIIDKTDDEPLKEFHSRLKVIKEDILNDTRKSPDKCHNWIAKIRSKIVPNTYTESKFESDISKNTINYIRCMCRMGKYVQKKGELKSLQIFPIRTSTCQNYVKINTSALIDIFIKSNKLECFEKAGDTKYQEDIWNTYFKFKKNGDYRYTKNGYSFNYELETDGYAVSLNFINDDEIEKKETFKKNKRKKRQETIDTKNDMYESDYVKWKEQKDNNKLIKEELNDTLQKDKVKEKKEEFKKLSKNEQFQLKCELELKEEFPYIENVIKDDKLRKELIRQYINGKIVLCDPGQKSPLKMMACNSIIHVPEKDIKMNNFGVSIMNGHKMMDYTNKTRIKFLKRQYYSELVEKWKSKKGAYTDVDIYALKSAIKNTTDRDTRKYLRDILKWKEKSLKELEKEMSNYNSKSCVYSEFIKYVKLRLKYNKKVSNQYDTEYLQKLNWFSYLNKRKHEDKLLNIIENEYGKDIIIVIGDWSAKGKTHHMPTPNIGLKRKLAERFKVYLIDEYLTSKLHYKHEVRCENMWVKIYPNETSTKLHSVLSYKIEKQVNGCKRIEKGCINRDTNSVLNMESILVELLMTGERPVRFNRSNNQIVHLGKQSDAKRAYRKNKKVD